MPAAVRAPGSLAPQLWPQPASGKSNSEVYALTGTHGSIELIKHVYYTTFKAAGAYLLQIDAMVDIVCSDIHLDVWEVAMQRPHGAVVGSRGVQSYNTTGSLVGTNAVKHCSTAGISKVHWQIQFLASLQCIPRNTSCATDFNKCGWQTGQ